MTAPEQVAITGPIQGGRRRSAPSGEAGPDALLFAVGAMLLTFVWRVHDQVPVVGAAKPALMATLLATTLYVLDTDPRRAVARLRSPIVRYVAILPILFVLTIPTSLWPGKSVEFLVKDYSTTFVFCALTALAIRSRRDVEWLAALHVIGATTYCAFVLARGKVGVDGRIAGLRYYDANDLGFVMVITVPLAVYFLRREAKPWMKWVAAAALAILSLTIVKTGSRGAFLGFIAVTGYILFQFTAIKRRTRVLAAVVGGVVMLAVGSEDYWARIQTLLRPQEDYNLSDNNLAGRKQVWLRGIGYMLRRPLLGVGVRNYSQAEGMMSEIGTSRQSEGRGFKWSAAHNSFIEMGAENGIPALIVFLSAIVISVRTMRRMRQRAPPGAPMSHDAALGQALLGGFLGYCTAGFFLSQAYSAYLYSLFGLAIGLSKLHQEPAAAAQRPAARRSAPPAPATRVA